MVLTIQDKVLESVEPRESKEQMQIKNLQRENHLLRKQMVSMEERIIDLERSIDAAIRSVERNNANNDAYYWDF